MSDKVCSDHKDQRRKLHQRCFAGLFISVFLILLTILIVWATLQPRKPSFTLEDATIFNLNISAPNVISTTIQVTVRSRNLNSNIGIYYDSMSAYATYHSQQITYYTLIPPVYQGHKEVNVWSPFVYGRDVPVAPYNIVGLSTDKSDGAISFIVKINARVKWRVGSIVTGRYHLHVTCPVSIPIRNSKSSGMVIGNAIKYQLSQSCSVNV